MSQVLCVVVLYTQTLCLFLHFRAMFNLFFGQHHLILKTLKIDMHLFEVSFSKMNMRGQEKMGFVEREKNAVPGTKSEAVLHYSNASVASWRNSERGSSSSVMSSKKRARSQSAGKGLRLGTFNLPLWIMLMFKSCFTAGLLKSLRITL